MPARATSRSTRTSTAAPSRKSSTATLRGRRSASARTSAHAVEIPNEGPDNTLRTQICHIFSDAQKSTATQRKLVINLRKIQETCCYAPPVQTKKKKGGRDEELEGFDESQFNEEVARCVVRVLPVKKSETVGDKVIRFLGLFLRHATEKDNAIFHTGEEDESEIPDDTPTTRLTSLILTSMINSLTAKDKTVRFRAAQITAHMINTLGNIDGELFDLIRLTLQKRLKDKEAAVRVQAVLGLGRLADADEDSDDDDGDGQGPGGLLGKLLDIMENDPGAEVRRVVLLNMPFQKDTLPAMLERSRDEDVATRRVFYGKMLPTLSDFRHMSLEKRGMILRYGLRDRDEVCRKSMARVFYERWISSCAAAYDDTPEEERNPDAVIPPNFEGLHELLERIDVTSTGIEEGIAHDAMRAFWEGRPDYREHITFDDDFWRDLDPESAFIVRSLNDYCIESEDDNLLEARIPEASRVAFFLEMHMNNLMEAVRRFAETAVSDATDDEKTLAQEEEADQAFVVEQLLHIALTLDFADEKGRRNIQSIVLTALERPELPEECTKLAVELLRTVCGKRGETEFCRMIWLNCISGVRDYGKDEEEAEQGADESFHSAQSEMGDDNSDTSEERPKTKKLKLSPEDEETKRERDFMIYAKCLHIAQCALENVECAIEGNYEFEMMLNTLIVPSLKQRDIFLRERGLVCLGLCALLSKNLAQENFNLFLHCFLNGEPTFKIVAIEILSDIIITHPTLLAPSQTPEDTQVSAASTVSSQPNPRIKPLTKALIKAFNSEDQHLTLSACTGASKLLLMGLLPHESALAIVKTFILAYFDPETSAKEPIRQALSYFLPAFSHSKYTNARLIAEVAVPVVTKLVMQREDMDEEMDEGVSWTIVAGHLAEWTDGRRVVGATEMGLDGKMATQAIAEVPHIKLAIDILERALKDTCSKDERKPLLTLLTKLSIPSTNPKAINRQDSIQEPAELVEELHQVVTEAVEAKLGHDAVSRNYMAKLEASLTKRLGEVAMDGTSRETSVLESRDGETEVTIRAEKRESVETEATTTTATDADAGESDATEVPEEMSGVEQEQEQEQKTARVLVKQEPVEREPVEEQETVEEEEEEDVDMTLAGMHAEGTIMPISEADEDEEDEDGDTTMTGTEVTVVPVKGPSSRRSVSAKSSTSARSAGSRTAGKGRTAGPRNVAVSISESDIIDSLLESEFSA
ncbi:hypothetical protein P154DRAFT_564912 [Amniculicola lignicola CBS 123094]|uniref:Nuclear condensin complex subunit 3 C-terminal domain-containing protein n=1 Tax=Amniculicola lignicola CBS 123094 TaxID=1392246 RepID=A0A6A5W897_9PLEO|nr:hypothetical protein P154DRAFT_564912 [Amniculicola lignicola CBS 123094]